ncbi:hypothetical protein B7486_68440, partial [cyanobacterium TDX16]
MNRLRCTALLATWFGARAPVAGQQRRADPRWRSGAASAANHRGRPPPATSAVRRWRRGTRR